MHSAGCPRSLLNRALTVKMSSELHVDQDFEKFDPWVYIQEHYGKLDCWHRNPLKYLHDFYTSHFQRGANLKVLNYGCGPIVAFEASAVLYAQEIVLAEYVKQNRAVAKLWLDKDPSRPDFSALYRYVVEELEGRGPGEVEERQDSVRHLSTICSCDIHQDPIIQKGYEGPYDVIYTGSCIEDACYTIEVFGAALSKLCDLLRPGGWLLMSVCVGTEPGTHCIYYVGSMRYVELRIRETDIYEILQRCGFVRESITILPLVHLSPEPLPHHLESTMYVIAQKTSSAM